MPIPFTLRQLEYVVAVAERGGISDAAQVLHVSQPSVSVAIRDLERFLGRRLFHRRAGQRLAITPAGRQFLVDARRTLAAAGRIGGQAEAAGEIGVACFRDLAAIYLPRLIAGFTRHEAGVGFRLAEGDLTEVQALLLDGRCELAISYDTGLQTGLITARLDRLTPHVLLPAAHPLADRDSIALTDLRGESFILEDYPSTIAFFRPLLQRHGLADETCRLAPSFEMQRSLVGNGLGVGMSYARPIPDVAYDGSVLACRPLAGDDAALDVVFVHLGEDTLSDGALRFLRHALARRG